MRIYLLILSFISFHAIGTTFQLQTVDQQLGEADGIIIGHFLKSKSIKLDDGKVVTQMIFKLNKEWGLQSDFFGMEEVIIHYPGGTVDGITTEVQGVPKFIPGEKVALLSKTVNNRYWGLNLGYGSYKVINYGKETMLINSLFPENPQVGQIRLQEFEAKVKKIKGSNLKVVLTPQYVLQEGNRLPASIPEGKKRAIASHTEEVENKQNQSELSVYWLIAILALCGGISHLRRHKNAD